MQVIFAAVLVVLIPITGFPIQVIDKHQEMSECKASVYYNAMRFAEGFDFASNDIDCPPSEVVVSSPEPDDIYGAIANASFVCYDNFFKGELSLFDVERGATDHICVICSYIEFEDEAVGKRLNGYPYYLLTENAPNGENLHHYFTGQNPTPGDIAAAKNHKGYIDTSEKYVVLFTYGKTKGYWDKTLSAVGAGGGFAAGLALAVSMALAPISFGGSAYIYVISIGVLGGGVAGGAIGPFLDVDYEPGIELVPFETEQLVQAQCMRLEQ